MSALDQAFIKAYAKDLPADGAAVATPPPPARPPAAAVRRTSAHHVEQLYHSGSLYRVESPRINKAGAVVPPPHAAMLPPTSPRRNVRRSVLRLLASQAASAPTELPAETPQRVARKVIIRHVSHSTPPGHRGRLRATLTQSFTADVEPIAELPPETISDAPPSASPPAPPPVEAVPAASPGAAPLNVALSEVPQFTVHGYWKQGEPAPATLVVADVVHLSQMHAAPLVTISLDALLAAEQATQHTGAAENDVAAYEPSMSRFAGKSLEDGDPRPTYRLDAEHGKSILRPHARFHPANESEQATTPPFSAEPQTPPVSYLPIAEPESHADSYIEAETIESAADDAASPTDLTFAESAGNDLTLLEEPLAKDQGEAGESMPDPAKDKQAAPLWEIDSFQWPKTCQKLFADEHSYLASAGGKLLAAVQDGLKVLAVTGSRRGEGRSTLSLCLARAAAQAGIQVAIMDADFARPQIASKIGLEIAFGWQDAALGKIPLSEAAVRSVADNITVLPLEASAAGRSLSLSDPRVTATVRAAAATFELVILDLGPIGPGEELAFPSGERCPLDAAIVVRDLRFATTSESEDIGHRLQDAGVEAVGIAENFVVDEELPATSV